jgi:hypothetical protein
VRETKRQKEAGSPFTAQLKGFESRKKNTRFQSMRVIEPAFPWASFLCPDLMRNHQEASCHGLGCRMNPLPQRGRSCYGLVQHTRQARSSSCSLFNQQNTSLSRTPDHYIFDLPTCLFVYRDSGFSL